MHTRVLRAWYLPKAVSETVIVPFYRVVQKESSALSRAAVLTYRGLNERLKIRSRYVRGVIVWTVGPRKKIDFGFFAIRVSFPISIRHAATLVLLVRGSAIFRSATVAICCALKNAIGS